MDKTRFIIAEATNYAAISKAFEEAKGNDGFIMSIYNDTHLINESTIGASPQVDSTLLSYGADVIIIEDDLQKVFEYFKIFDKSLCISSIVACTTKKSALKTHALLASKGAIRKTKLVILDFDLYETTSIQEKQSNTLEIYKTLISENPSRYNSYKIIAITAYEGKTVEFSRLQKNIRNTSPNFDLVLSKKFLDHKDLLENIFRNIPGLYEPSDPDYVVKLKSPILLSKLYKSSQNFSTKRLNTATFWLNRIDEGIGTKNARFVVGKMFDRVKRKNGSSFKSGGEISRIVGNYSSEMRHLLYSSKNDEKWLNLKAQITSFGVFSSHLTKRD